MLKLHTTTSSLKVSPESATAIRHRAEKAVDFVLQNKPGGLLAIEEQLTAALSWEKQLSEFKSKHNEFFLVGIGGSSLGVQVFAEAFQKKNIHFIDNVDALHFESQLGSIKDLQKVGWLFVSKSGRTIETLAALEFVHQYYEEKSLALESHSLVITEEKSSDLYNWAQRKNLTVFPIPLSVGGRFSVLSSVGLVPAILMGLDIQNIKNGALKAYSERNSLITMTEAVLSSFEREEWVTLLWSYCSRLKSFGAWWQQLWAESLAKKTNRAGAKADRVSTPVPLVGATDQHSILQQVMEGARDKFVIFLRVDQSESGELVLKKPSLQETESLKGKTLGQLLAAEAQATQQALEQVGISNMSLQIPQLREANLSFLMMYFQLLVMALGESLNINTFDQPGVELGKIMAKKLLSENFRASQSPQEKR